MNRSKKILIVCHCVLNANAKITPLASVAGVFSEAVAGHIDAGCGLFQLPCPETSYLGMDRWGMTREQYDHQNFHAHCRDILRYPLIQLRAFRQAGYEFTGIVGMDGSPNCGVNETCEGFTGGEICTAGKVSTEAQSARVVPGRGVFMTELLEMLSRAEIRPVLFAVKETTKETLERRSKV